MDAFESGDDANHEWVDDRSPQPPSGPGADHSAARWGGLLNLLSRPANSPASATSESSDGVFGNLVAKEEDGCASSDTQISSRALDDDDITPQELPPTYEEAAADSTPSYWETTIMASGWCDDVLVNDLPVGTHLHFLWNALISFAFGFVGFFATYLFHTTHAANAGSWVGLGLTLAGLSFDMAPSSRSSNGSGPVEFRPDDPNSYNDNSSATGTRHGSDPSLPAGATDGSRFMSNLLFIVSIVIILKAINSYRSAYAVKMAILNSPSQVPTEDPEDTEESRAHAEQTV